MYSAKGEFFAPKTSFKKGRDHQLFKTERKKDGFFFSFMDFISWGDFYAIFLLMPLLFLLSLFVVVVVVL
jgi:hypothetical protein